MDVKISIFSSRQYTHVREVIFVNRKVKPSTVKKNKNSKIRDPTEPISIAAAIVLIATVRRCRGLTAPEASGGGSAPLKVGTWTAVVELSSVRSGITSSPAPDLPSPLPAAAPTVAELPTAIPTIAMFPRARFGVAELCRIKYKNQAYHKGVNEHQQTKSF